MDFFEVLKNRRSIRSFISKDVKDSDIEKILTAASLAPTARNIQPWEFVVTKDSSLKEKIAQLVSPNGAFVAQAPVCITIFCKNTKYYLEDGCAATTQALLTVSSLGLGACWIAGDKKEYAQGIGKLLNVPSEYKLVSLIAFGYSEEAPTPEKRKIVDMTHREKF
jgi:nitroreductase